MNWRKLGRSLYRRLVRKDLSLPSAYGFNFFLVQNDVKSAKCILGIYEKEDVDALTSLPADNGIIVDVGANIGFYSLLFAKKFPNSIVYSFDPSNYNEHRVKQNLSINGGLASRINFSRMAISSKKGTLEFFAVPGVAGHAWGRIGEPPAAALEKSSTESYPVEVDSLDNILAEKIGDIKLIKIDVEGHELEVFNGMKKIIQTERAVIMFEVSLSYLILHPGQFQDLLKAFDGTSYQPFVPTEKGLVPYIWPFLRVFNMYMIPETVRREIPSLAAV